MPLVTTRSGSDVAATTVPPGAHAEAVDGAAVLRVVDEPVVGRAEERMAGVRPEAGAVDERLRVLDAKADRERLGFEVDAALVQHRERVARAVPRRDDDVLGVDLVPLLAGRCVRFARHRLHDGEAAHRAALDAEVDDARAEADLAAEPLDLVAHALDHADQPERADVRLGDEADLLGRAGADELVDHLARQVARVADLAPELAVGEGAGAAFAELHVRFRIEDAAPPQAPGVAACARARPCRARGRAAAGPPAPAGARRRCRTGRSRPRSAGRRRSRRRSLPARRPAADRACRVRRAGAESPAWRASTVASSPRTSQSTV